MGARVSFAEAKRLGLVPTPRGRPHAGPVVAGCRLVLTIPVRVTGSLNSREHWSARHRRVKVERADAGQWLFLLAGRHPPPGLITEPVVATLTRLGGRKMDDDNLAGCLKAIRDAVSLDWFKVDDGDSRFTWVYAQEPGGAAGVRVELAAG